MKPNQLIIQMRVQFYEGNDLCLGRITDGKIIDNGNDQYTMVTYMKGRHLFEKLISISRLAPYNPV